MGINQRLKINVFRINCDIGEDDRRLKIVKKIVSDGYPTPMS